jgi:hypothetical protein
MEENKIARRMPKKNSGIFRIAKFWKNSLSAVEKSAIPFIFLRSFVSKFSETTRNRTGRLRAADDAN